MIRVLVVDDSRVMRALVRHTLEQDVGIQVVGEVGTALEAREAVKVLNPDVMTLDVEMPGMDGLDFLDRIMRLRPMPVIMVSTLTTRGAEVSLQAMELGAIDCVAKPGMDGTQGFARLAETVRAAAGARPRAHRPVKASAPPDRFVPDGKLVAIGSSTGGVEALLSIISCFPANCPPTVITQHMPPTFTASFARRLDRASAATVAEATDGAPLQPGHVYLAPGGALHLEVVGKTDWRCRLVERGPVNGHRPSVDVLFQSVAKVAGKRAVGVILTGMGRDGASGLGGMRAAGARTLGQDEASCVVYGMPKVAQEVGAVERQCSLSAMAGEILHACAVPQRERV